MKALVFDPTIPRFLTTRTLALVSQGAVWARTAPLQYRDVADPPLPGDDWVRVAVTLGGVCGSDLHTIRLDASPALSAISSFPFVLGHENVGRIAETGPAVTDLTVGQRVTVEPTLPCVTRGVTPPCRYCAAGNYNLCIRVADGHISPGLMIGACRDTGGSWGPSFVAHRSQVFPLADAVSDENALMAEPFAVAVHSAVSYPPADRSTVLVIGGGVIGQCAIAALRATGSGARIIALVKHSFQEETARRMGADVVVPLQKGDGHYDELADLTGGVLRRPILGKRVLLGGADMTVECVGTSRSIDDALRLTAPGGRTIILGLASLANGVDWTPVWLKELQVTGSYIYRWDVWQGRRVRTMDLVLEWMAAGRVDLSPLVTHRFPLRDYVGALKTAMGKPRSGAFKVAFTP
ncbi:MAG TPA: alcohol dehydrogenase catalytic domain-containing protein [bacterium]